MTIVVEAQSVSKRTGRVANDDTIPVMPAELVEYANMLLLDDRDSLATIESLAQQAYKMWKANDFQQVEVIAPRDFDADLTPCFDAALTDTFDAEFPLREDFNSERDWEREYARVDINVATAKKMCSECPLRMQCLASSITVPVRGRDREVDDERLSYEEYGIKGGWGPSARARIFERLLEIWGADPEA